MSWLIAATTLLALQTILLGIIAYVTTSRYIKTRNAVRILSEANPVAAMALAMDRPRDHEWVQ